MSILTFSLASVNFAPASTPDVEVADDFRPTADPAFYPTVEEDTEASELLNGDEGEPDWDALAEESSMMDRYLIGCYAC